MSSSGALGTHGPRTGSVVDRRNPMLLRRNIERIEKLSAPSASDMKRLKVLKKQLEQLEQDRSRFRDQHRPYNVKRSVFYDPELNPQGTPPEGWKQVYLDDLDSEYETDDSVKHIRLPPRPVQGELGKHEGHKTRPVKQEAQITYESEEVLRDLDKEAVKFVPRALKTKEKEREVDVEQPPSVVDVDARESEEEESEDDFEL